MQPTAAARQRARASLRLGRGVSAAARVDVTSGGLLAIGALVSSILLATAVLVRVAVREAHRRDANQG